MTPARSGLTTFLAVVGLLATGLAVVLAGLGLVGLLLLRQSGGFHS